MKPTSKDNSLHFLSTINTNHLEFDTKIALLSFHNQTHSRLVDSLMLLIEYLQLVSQAFLFNLFLYGPGLSNKDTFSEVAIFGFKLFHPGRFLTHDNETTYNIVMSVVFVFLILKYLLTAYISVVAHKNSTKRIRFLIGLWRWIFRLQGRVIYFFITSFLLEVGLSASNSQTKAFGLDETSIIAICVLIICMEYIFSLILQIKFCCVLPSKSILSAKDNILEIITLTQKFTAQILELIFSSTLAEYAWVPMILSLIFSLTRVAYFFRTLSLYNIRAFLYQGALIAIVSTADFVCLVQAIASSSDQDSVDIYYIFVLWIIMSILTFKIVHGSLSHYLTGFSENRQYTTPKLMLQKLHALKQLTKPMMATGFAEKMPWLFLINATAKTNATRILSHNFNFTNDNMELIDSKDLVKRMCIQYLENLLHRFPKSDIIKLYTINYYAKKLKMYGIAMKMINDYMHSHPSKLLRLNASLLLCDIKIMTNSASNDDERKINLPVYIKNMSTLAQWKSFMLDQVDIQMSLYEETMTEIPDLSKIFTLAQKADRYRSTLERKSNALFSNLPSHCIEPYMIYAHYQLVVNHSVASYRAYVRHHFKKYKQYEKHFKNNKLILENLYQNTGLVILSAQKGKVGKILFCTKAIENIYGGDVRKYMGSNFDTFGPPAMRPFYSALYNHFVDSRANNKETYEFRSFGQHRDGYIQEVDCCMDISLFDNHGLCLYGVVRKVMSDRDYLLVHENGEIEGISRKLGRRLGLFNDKEASMPKLNISSISEELNRVNEAFNIMTLPEKYKPNDEQEITYCDAEELEEKIQPTPENKNIVLTQAELKITMSFEEATKLHSIFASEGKEIVITMPEDSNEGYTYTCTVTTTNYGSTQIKTFILEETADGLDDMKLASPLLVKENVKVKSTVNVNRVGSIETCLPGPSELRKGSNSNTFLVEGGKQSTPTQELPSHPSQNINTKISLKGHRHVLLMKGKGFDDRYRSKTATGDNDGDLDLSKSGGDIIKPKQSMSSQMTQSSHSSSTLRAYKTALTRNTTTKTFRIICFCFYVMLIALFGSQLKLKNTLNVFLESLEIKKNILGHASDRDNTLAGVHGNANSLWLTWLRFAGGENTPALNATFVRYYGVLLDQLVKLDHSNHALLLDMQSLEAKTSEMFFHNDVKIYDTFFDAPKQVYMNYNNFKAIDKIFETGARARQKAMAWDYVNAKDDFFFLFRNPENDLLIKSTELGSILDQSLTEERESAQSLTMNYLAVTLVCLVMASVALCVMIWKQYLTERNNVLAVVKLDSSSIKTVHDRLKEFKYKIENEKSFEKTSVDLAEYLQPLMKSKIAKTSTGHKRHLHNTNYSGIFRKYLFYTLNLIVFISALFGLVLWSSLSAKVSIQFFHKKQAQLRLSGQMKFITTVSVVVSEELLSRNNGSKIMNEWTADISPTNLDGLEALRDNIRGEFLEDDRQYDPVIGDILFESGRCDLLPADIKPNCDTLRANGILTNYMSVLNNLEKFLRNPYEKFMLMTNRTTSALNDLRNLNLALLRPMRQVVEYQSVVMFDLINAAFEEDLSNIAEQRNTIFAVITVFLVVLSITAWFSLLHELREANNRFKKVLQCLPAHVVLQSFLLRLFLMGNSKSSLRALTNV